ncbi:MAG: VF530 family DNA-binding protein [Bacteroidia bacterium]
METQKNNPLHGVTLAMMLVYLEENIGWEAMAAEVNINCFKFDPNLKSSLAFLRKTPWAREQVERLYVRVRGI